MASEPQIDPESLVARIIAELQANPEAQRLLLRALLTEEFLGIPVRLERIEGDISELKADVAELKTDVAELKTDMIEVKANIGTLTTHVGSLTTHVGSLTTHVGSLTTHVGSLTTDVGSLKGFALESLLHRRIRPLIGQRLGLRRPRVMQSAAQEPLADLITPMESSADDGFITTEQANRVDATDLIVRGQRRETLQYVWIAVEASHKVRADDIRRARETADILATVFDEESFAVVAGHSIDPPDLERADAAGVIYLEVEERF
jgi:regulator of replication initiation timing